MAKQKSVESTEDQPFRSASGTGYDANVPRLKAVLANVRKRNWAGINLKCFHLRQRNKGRRLLLDKIVFCVNNRWSFNLNNRKRCFADFFNFMASTCL